MPVATKPFPSSVIFSLSPASLPHTVPKDWCYCKQLSVGSMTDAHGKPQRSIPTTNIFQKLTIYNRPTRRIALASAAVPRTRLTRNI